MRQGARSDNGNHARPVRIANRYEVRELLGRGGMASVYRVTDLVSGRDVALKQLLEAERFEMRSEVSALFEREYHTLAHLCHPRVIEVYDYGVVPGQGPYYTMELLDGGDLRMRTPLDWSEACRILFDVCSSLALLHSRRLLHRDISPRNIRCTRDGRAKLIDFGAMTEMGRASAQIVGTPGFTAPETVYRTELDGRADLFSLGATLYFALTGCLAYPARTFSEAMASWTIKPLPPSARVSGIPAALDELVMSLLSIEPALRPQTAFDVMQRLAAIAGFERSEPEGVSRAYLSTPVLIGREAILDRLRVCLARARHGRGAGLIIRADAGLGRSRVLDACVLEAKTLGTTVLRANAAGPQEAFSVALDLTKHLLSALAIDGLDDMFPELLERAHGAPTPRASSASRSRLKDVNLLRKNPEQLQQAICKFLLTVSKTRTLVIAVDDVHRIDEPSAAVLATLVDKAERRNLLVVLTAESNRFASFARDVLARRCEELALSALSAEQTRQLFRSVFGDLPNLDAVAHEIHQVARGNPRESLEVAQYLVDRYIIEYSAGTWTLPAKLNAADLPISAEAAIVARIATLSPAARFLAEAHALAFSEVLTREDYHALCPELDTRALDEAISDLFLQQALVSDGRWYSLANRVWVAALRAGLDAEALQQRHGALLNVYRDKLAPARIHHLGAAGLHEQALDEGHELGEQFAQHIDLHALLQLNVTSLAQTIELALTTAQRLRRPARQIHDLRRWMVTISVASDASYYWHAAEAWLAQLKLDSGLTDWENEPDAAAPEQRLLRAFHKTHLRQLAAPEAERGYNIEEAIRLLAQYVVLSIAIGAKTSDTALLATLPALLEPFASLSPVLEAIWQNAVASRELHCDCLYERARVRWIEVHKKLDAITGKELQHVENIRNAIACAVGLTEAMLGIPSAVNWATQLDQDPLQKISATQLRRIVRLEQGDWAGAEQLRRHAEVLTLQARAPQMFSAISSELSVHAAARDLAGVKEAMARIEPLALRHPGWLPHLMLAEARFQLIRGDCPAAENGFRQVIEMTALDEHRVSPALRIWIEANAGLSEALLALDRASEARDCALSTLDVCNELQVDAAAHIVVRALALAQASLGEFSSAIEQLENLLGKQRALGVTGLKLGLSYEARAQVAIWAGDAAGFEQYARLTAREYRYAAGCPLGVRYERLLNDARRLGFVPVTEPTMEEPPSTAAAIGTMLPDADAAVMLAFSGAQDLEDCASRGLRLVCDARAARGGYFYVSTAHGVSLAASYELDPPTGRLRDLVQEYLAREVERSEARTVVAARGGALEASRSDAHAGSVLDRNDLGSTVIDGTDYEFLLVTSDSRGAGRIAGVIAMVGSERRPSSSHQSRLLTAIALHVLRASNEQRG